MRVEHGQRVLRGADHERAPDHVGVTADVLGGGVHDDVGPECQRVLQVRRGEGVVDDQQRTAVVGDPGQRSDVRDAEQRVGGRLDPEHPGPARPDRRRDRLEVTQRHGGVLHPPRLGDLGEQTVGAAVGVVGQDDVLAGAGEGADQGVLGR